MRLEEPYDVVDKKGNKIGEARWTEIHTKGLLHKTVHGIVFKDQARYETLIKRRSSKMHQGPGLLELAVAGHVLSGYTPEQTIEKEIKEELFENKNIPKDTKIKRVGFYFNNDIPNNHEIAYVFEIIHPGPFFASEESEKPFWIGWKDLILDMKTSPEKYAQYSINAINEYPKRFRSKS